ncbi:MAG TPA: methylated-DNA--[protein]-cysteine S-methyltransferase [Vitreimonas sp.]|uniref:methylated-DNA--[protein]-cysteine S-methyltransferase n=1 Tax=Vitreimonas sp. TaxID=3069702 RepID=UPI002D3EF82D|nr:methylated-DNA--[protein]-cysteine S-methyltransferase [Vitreimonas sp.]HYD86102.1 methylated-DNA--[protein]-cysteine S-methyltransferase [Vitreimonas sp.]
MSISTVYESPCGPLTLISNGAALTDLQFENPRYPYAPAPAGADAVLDKTRRQLDAYFAGKLRAFDLPLAPKGTPFQQRVWQALLAIPYGATRSYGQQAAAIGSPQASRAVGLANGRNPIAIVIPCHRVIGANGSLTGYGGGMERKQLLLELEQGQPLLR